MRRFYNGRYLDLTQAETSELQARSIQRQLREQQRPLKMEEVSRMIIAERINSLDLDDNTALRAKAFYPAWADLAGRTMEQGHKVRHGGKLWTVLQAHTMQTQWEPGAAGTESLYAAVNESHAGTLEDPIPYGGNLALEEGLYYHQDLVLYRCIRATGQPVYQPLGELAGIYVEVV